MNMLEAWLVYYLGQNLTNAFLAIVSFLILFAAACIFIAIAKRD
jgi:hypothetical protein